jgi:hypothetical protein
MQLGDGSTTDKLAPPSTDVLTGVMLPSPTPTKSATLSSTSTDSITITSTPPITPSPSVTSSFSASDSHTSSTSSTVSGTASASQTSLAQLIATNTDGSEQGSKYVTLVASSVISVSIVAAATITACFLHRRYKSRDCTPTVCQCCCRARRIQVSPSQDMTEEI